MEPDCRQCDEGLVEFLYGEFDEQQQAAFELHLRRCAKCAAAAEQMRQTQSIFADLELKAPPPLADDDPLLAAALAKAEQMGSAAERIAAAGRSPDPSLWARLVQGLRGAAMRPALGTAFLVVLVAGVGAFYLSDRPEPRSVSGPLVDSPALSQVPLEEVRTAQPSVEIPPVGPLTRLDDSEAQPPLPVEPEPRQTPEEELQPTVAQQPVRPRPTRSQLRARPPSAPEKRAPSERSAFGTNRPTAEPLERSAATLDGAEGERRPSPIVLEAQQVPDATRAEAPRLALPASQSQQSPTPIIPTPPLPQAGAYQGQGQQQAPTSRAVPRQASTPAPTPAPAQPSAMAPAVQQPTRVETPGQERYRRGMEAFRGGQYRDAAEELNEFVRSPSAPRHLVPEGLHTLAVSQQRSGNLSASARTYDQLLSQHRGYQRRAQTLIEAAQVNARLGRYARAETLLRELSAIPGWSTRAQSEMARIQHRRAGESTTLGPDSAYDAAEEVGAEPAAAPPTADEPAGY